MQTIEIINALIEEAEFWLDETGMMHLPPSFTLDNLRGDLMVSWGIFTPKSDGDETFETRANFCLLIAAALESEQ